MTDKSSSKSSTSWPWRKIKSSSKSSTSLVLASTANQHEHKEDNVINSSANTATSGGGIAPAKSSTSVEVVSIDEVAITISNATSSLARELAAARDEIETKEASVKQHQKVAEDAVAGWEKAESEALSYKRELEASNQQKSILEDRVAHLDAALKECMRQVRHVREEQAERMEEALASKSREWEKIKSEVDARQAELQGKLMESQAQNNAMAKSLQERARRISEANEARAKAETDVKLLEVRLGSYEKEISALKYELHVSAKELEIRNEEVEFVKRSADAAHKQHLDGVKRMANLEADVNRLRNLLKKKLPGPAAIAQMRKEVENLKMVDINGGGSFSSDHNASKNRSRSNGIRSPSQYMSNTANSTISSPRSLSNSMISMYSTSPSRLNNHSINHSHGNNALVLLEQERDLEMLRDRMLAMDEENNLLKEALSKRNEELQGSRLLCAKMASKLSSVVGMVDEAKNSVNAIDSVSLSAMSMSNGVCHGVGDGDGGDDDDKEISKNVEEADRAESWASALISELAHLEKEKCGTSNTATNPSAVDESGNVQTNANGADLTVANNGNRCDHQESESITKNIGGGEEGHSPLITSSIRPIKVKDSRCDDEHDDGDGDQDAVHEEKRDNNINILCNGHSSSGRVCKVAFLSRVCEDLGKKLGEIENHLKPSAGVDATQCPPDATDGVAVDGQLDLPTDGVEARDDEQIAAPIPADNNDSDRSGSCSNNEDHKSAAMSNSHVLLLQAMVDEAHKKFSELERAIHELAAGLHRNSKEEKEEEEGEQEAAENVAELNRIIQELREEVEKASTDVAVHVDKEAAMAGRVAELEADVGRLTSELAAAEAEAEKLRADVASLSAELAEQKRSYDDVAAKMEEKLSATQSFDDSNGDDLDSRKERELVAAKEKLGECQRTILALGKQLTALLSPPRGHSPGGSFDTATSSMDSASLVATGAGGVGHPYFNQHHNNNTHPYIGMEESIRYHQLNRRQAGPPLTPSRVSSAGWATHNASNGNVPRGNGSFYDADESYAARGGFARYAMSGPQGAPLQFPDQHQYHGYDQQAIRNMSGQLHVAGQVPPASFYAASGRYNGGAWAPPSSGNDGQGDDLEGDGHRLALTLYQSPRQQQSSVISPARSPASYYDQVNGTGRADLAFYASANTANATATTTKEVPPSSASGLSRLFKSKKKH